MQPNLIQTTLSHRAVRALHGRLAAAAALTRGAARATTVGAVLLVALLAGCNVAAPAATPPIVAGTAADPREVNIIARDYTFVPSVVDVVPGETVLLHIINGGVEVHEVVIGDGAVQDAWEAAEAATVGTPPGPTPIVAVAPELAGLRVVVQSGERRDVRWTVPEAPTPGGTLPTLVVGCHIPGHWAKGMVVPIRFVLPGS